MKGIYRLKLLGQFQAKDLTSSAFLILPSSLIMAHFCSVVIAGTLLTSLLGSRSVTAIAATVGTCKVSDEKNLTDDSELCRILKDLPSEAVIYEEQYVCFCVVGTSACSEAIFEGLPYFGKLKFNSTEEKKLPVFKFCFEKGVISLRDNGARVHFVLLKNDLINTDQSTITNLTVLGPPNYPEHLNVLISCTTVFITWSPSDTASYYIINVQCGGTYVINETVDGTSYQFTYQHNIHSKHCVVSIVAVNGAGHSKIKNTTAVLAKDPMNSISYYDIGVVIQEPYAFVYLDMMVNQFCPLSFPSYFEICSINERRCVNMSAANITQTDARWYTDVSELPLLLHSFYNIAISICNEPKFRCKVVTKKLKTFHTQKAGSCNSNGSCLLYCELARGSQIRGCVYRFTRQDQDREPFNVFVHVSAGDWKQYLLEDGIYNVSIYDWPWEEDWRANPPAFNEIITVNINKPQINDDTPKTRFLFRNLFMETFGISFGTLALILVTGIATTVLIILSVWCYRKHYINNEGTDDLEKDSGRDEQNRNNETIELNLLPDNERKEGEVKKAAATTIDVCVTSFNSIDSEDTPSVPSEVSEQQQQPLANSTAVEEIDEDIENGVLGAEQTDCKTTEEKEVHMTMVDGVSETETTYDGSDLPLLESPPKRKHAHNVGGKLQSQMVVPELEVYRYANFAHEDTGTSVLTGKAMVASTEKDHKNSMYLIGGQLLPMKKEVVNETYSPGDPSQAQTPMDLQTHEVVT